MTKKACLALAAQYEELCRIDKEPISTRWKGNLTSRGPPRTAPDRPGPPWAAQYRSPVPADKQKYVVQAWFGRVAIAKAHALSASVLGARTSPSLQTKLGLLAVEHVFTPAPPLVELLLGIRVSTSQVYRRTQTAAQFLPAASVDARCPPVSAGMGPVYGVVDGWLLVADSGWQEVKVGHIFQHRALASKPGPFQYVA